MEHVFRLVLTPISQAKNYTVEILCTLTKDYTQLLHSLVTTLTIDYNNYVICVCISRPCTITFMKKFLENFFSPSAQVLALDDGIFKLCSWSVLLTMNLTINLIQIPMMHG